MYLFISFHNIFDQIIALILRSSRPALHSLKKNNLLVIKLQTVKDFHTVVAKSLRPKSIFVCEATCSAVLHQKSFPIASPFLVCESVTQETVSIHKQSSIQQWGCFCVFSSLFSCLWMGKKRSLSAAERAQIELLRQEGYTERAINERLAVSKTAVHQAVVNFKNCGSYSGCKRSGRQRKTTRRDDIFIKRCVVKSPACSVKKIRAELGKLVRESAEEPSVAV